MTFIADSDRGPLAPEEAAKDDRLSCVECDESLGIVTAHRREGDAFVSRHFRHPPSESCGGGESDTHKAMKSVALSKLKERYPDHAKAGLEQTVGDRQADVYLRFEEPHDTLGYGVIAEAQYRNKDKDIEGTTDDYLDAGYSVFWLYEDDYDDLDVELGEPVSVWPNAVPRQSEWFWQKHSTDQYYVPTKGRHTTGISRRRDIRNWRRYVMAALGYSFGEGERDLTGVSLERDVTLPREWFEENKGELESAYMVGAGEFDLIRWLSDNNAPRRCSECGEDAMIYLFTDGHISRFVCDRHVPDPAIKQARQEAKA